MERLTYWCDDGMGGGEYRVNENGAEYSGHSIDRLAAYEDTGLEPETITRAQETLLCFGHIGIKRGNEIVTAEEEGRLLVLPCRIGDPVWFVIQDVDDPSRWEICEPQKITEVGPSGFWISGLLDEPDGMYMFTPWSALGGEAFLSREAAEAALEEREDK